MAFSRKVGKAIGAAIDCKRVGITVIGLEVPHAHVHLIPLHTMENARFTHKEKLTPEEFEVIANKIVSNFK
jgi:histidine triad (HIT) family protein